MQGSGTGEGWGGVGCVSGRSLPVACEWLSAWLIAACTVHTRPPSPCSRRCSTPTRLIPLLQKLPSGTELIKAGSSLDSLFADFSQAAEAQREGASKLESHVNSIWDQIRHVENSLSQRLTLAETSQVGF